MPERSMTLDRALNELTSEFPDIRARIVVQMLLGHLKGATSVAVATAATRNRIIDACALV